MTGKTNRVYLKESVKSGGVMYKCENECSFWGKYSELEIVREFDQHPYGDSTCEEITIELYCPECLSDELTEWKEAS